MCQVRLGNADILVTSMKSTLTCLQRGGVFFYWKRNPPKGKHDELRVPHSFLQKSTWEKDHLASLLGFLLQWMRNTT
jgi:hypothetical protein